MTMNGVMALILRYFAEFGSFRGQLRKSGRRYTDTFCEWNVAQESSFSDDVIEIVTAMIWHRYEL